MPARALLLLFLLFVARFPAVGQTIRGEVLDMDTHKPINNVDILNIYTSLDISSNDAGAFIIAASSGQLLEFKKEGYKTTRVRIPQGYVPSYFRIIMKPGFSDLKPGSDIAAANHYDYKSDSIRYHDVYKTELDFPKLTGFDAIASPFSALSAKNREVWRFQDEYEEFEKEKYVDKMFNPELITKMTGLTGDSLRMYMRRARPSYEQLRGMNDYNFYNFIKTGVYHFRNAGTRRNSG